MTKEEILKKNFSEAGRTKDGIEYCGKVEEVALKSMQEFSDQQNKIILNNKKTKKIIALVIYNKWIDGGHVLLEGNFIEKSKIVEVKKLTDLNDISSNIKDVKILG